MAERAPSFELANAKINSLAAELVPIVQQPFPKDKVRRAKMFDLIDAMQEEEAELAKPWKTLVKPNHPIVSLMSRTSWQPTAS